MMTQEEADAMAQALFRSYVLGMKHARTMLDDCIKTAEAGVPPKMKEATDDERDPELNQAVDSKELK